MECGYRNLELFDQSYLFCIIRAKNSRPLCWSVAVSVLQIEYTIILVQWSKKKAKVWRRVLIYCRGQLRETGRRENPFKPICSPRQIIFRSPISLPCITSFPLLFWNQHLYRQWRAKWSFGKLKKETWKSKAYRFSKNYLKFWIIVGSVEKL